MHHFFTIRCTFKVGGTCGYLNILIYHCEKSYGLTKVIININNYSVKTAILYPLSSYLVYLFAPTVSLAPVEVANVASPRRRGPADNMPRAPRNLDPALPFGPSSSNISSRSSLKRDGDKMRLWRTLTVV